MKVPAPFESPDYFLTREIFCVRGYGKVRAVVRIQQGALLVPQRAVSELQGGYQVAIVGDDNKVNIRPVKVGDRIGNEWVIAEGLKPGERVVAEGVQSGVRDSK